ncbi:hypothetical protein GCM10010517_51230 [Streptosporangium fragile]|uniref:Uncharacterized protein n=1 Tax=Streptosporangium fragile TaxID=46186 RepID=A0ABP6ILW1_9ACTN
MTLFALTAVWVKPQRGQAASTGGGLRIPVSAVAGEAVDGPEADGFEADGFVPGSARSVAPPVEQLASASASAVIAAAETGLHPERPRPADAGISDDTCFLPNP